jgi:NAD dependent epimerase/dehydratase family enzyme
MGLQAGGGQQWTSWIGRDELASIIEFALTTKSLVGPVNAVSPNPLHNSVFATTAAHALGKKPGRLMSAFLVRLVMGEMGEQFLLASRRIQPAKLLAAGYAFRFPELEGALKHELGIISVENKLRDSQPVVGEVIPN